MNPLHFTVVCGVDVAEALDRERALKVKQSATRPGCFESESLCAWQRSVNGRGFRDVELVKSIYGWSVRAGSGLQDFALLASSRQGQLDGSLEDAVRWATRWCNENPERRYAWMHKSEDRPLPPPSPAVVRAEVEAGITFADPKAAFEEAIRAGRLSDDRSSPVYAGRFMYMGTKGERHLFKNSNTRAYLP